MTAAPADEVLDFADLAADDEVLDYADVAQALRPLFLPSSNLDWMARSRCRQVDPDQFFPERGASPRDALAVCRSCPVRWECLQYALDNDEQFGVWGGLSETDRRRVKRGELPVPSAEREAS